MNTLLVLILPLVAKTPDPADVKPGWLGFGVFIALLVAVVLLWLSMRRHLKKVDFEEQPDPRERSEAPREAQDQDH
jgi:high-affinity Fe2+/Pb2+ permease